MIQDFISQITDANGLARPTRFSVQIVPPRIMQSLNLGSQDTDQARVASLASLLGTSPQSLGAMPNYFRQMGVEGTDIPDRLDFMCTRAELPGKTYGVSDIRTYGSFFSMPHVDVYADITLTFIVGQDMLERHFFDAWSYTIQDPDTSDFNYIDDYSTTMDVYQLDDTDNATYGVRFFQCWPLTIGQMNLDYSAHNQYHTLPITFEYRKWINFRVNAGTPTTIEPSGGVPRGFESTIYDPRQKG
jgi:hypothetical protein